MKTLNKDSMSRGDVLVDKAVDDTNRGLWKMIRDDNPRMSEEDQLKILRGYLRDVYRGELGTDGVVPEERVKDHIRGGKRVRDGDHALLVRDLTTRVFVWEAGRWREIAGEFGGVKNVVPQTVGNLGDFVKEGVRIREHEGVLSTEHERLRRMENDLELHQITATVLEN